MRKKEKREREGEREKEGGRREGGRGRASSSSIAREYGSVSSHPPKKVKYLPCVS